MTKEIEINSITGVIMEEEGRIIIQQQDTRLRRLVEVVLTKEEIIALAAQLHAEEVVEVNDPQQVAPRKSYEFSVYMAGGRSYASIIEGKPATKRWQHMGWSPLPDLTNIKHHYKGDYLITEVPDVHNPGEIVKTRYRITEGV